jgi:hypothetical protein
MASGSVTPHVQQQHVLYYDEEKRKHCLVTITMLALCVTQQRCARVFAAVKAMFGLDDNLLGTGCEEIEQSATLSRGGKPYLRAAGWLFIPLNVMGKYDGGDDAWLAKTDAPGVWAVAYHGTGAGAVGPIVRGGYDLTMCDRFVHGKGIYSAPSVHIAELFARQKKELVFEGTRLVVVLQNRVDTRRLVEVPGNKTDTGGVYYVTQPDAIRPYGILLKALS